MAANVGKIFVELSLDDKPYKQALSGNLASTQATATGIETSWKALGKKNDATYDAMRRSYENALALIKKSTTATAQDIIRAEEAKNAKIAALNKQQFGEQRGMIDSLKTHWIAYTAVVAASMQAWSMAKAGAEFDEQRGILTNLGQKYGQTADQIVEAMDRASDNQIAKTDLMKISLGGLAKGLDPTQMKELASAALILGDAVGVSAKTALDDLTSALETGRTKGLKTYLGTTLDLKTAFGELESELTAAEKANAMYNITIMAAADLQARQTKAVDGAADSIAQIEKKFNDATLAGSRFMKIFAVTAVEDLFSPLERLKRNIEGIGNAVGATAGGKTIDQFVAGTPTDPDELEHGASMRRAVGAAALERIRLQAQARADKEKADKEGAQARKKLEDDARKDLFAGIEAETKEYEDGLNAQAAALDNSLAERKKLEDEDRKNLFAGIEAETVEYERSLIAAGEAVDERGKATLERIQAERDMFQDMRGFEQDYYTTTKLMIESQAAKYKKLGIDEVTVAKWTEGEKLKALDAYVDKSGTLYERLEKRTRKYQEEAGDIHKALYNAIDAGAKNLEGQMSDNFFNVLTGKFDEVRLDWDSMWSAMSRSASNYVAQIATDMAMSYGTKAAKAGGSWLWDIAGGAGIASGVASGASSAWDSILSFFTGYASGSLEISKDKLAKLHKGEMVIPAEQAEMIRQLFESGYGSPSDAGIDLSGFENTPNMDALGLDTIGGYSQRGAIAGGFTGVPGGPAGIAVGAVMGGARGTLVGLGMHIANIMGLTEQGRVAGYFDKFAASPESKAGYAQFGRDIGYMAQDAADADRGGGAGMAGQDAADADRGGGGEWRYGGISRGPESGYRATLHGTEAVVPLSGGRSIPVKMKGDGAGLIPVHIHLHLNNREIADAMYEVSRSGYKTTHVRGITDI